MNISYASAVTAPNTTPLIATTSITSALSITTDINHPYYLSSADHPGLSLVNELLTDNNYHRSSRSI